MKNLTKSAIIIKTYINECNIPVGGEIAFIEDENIKAVVVDDRHIEYNGETTSVSALARKLKGFKHPVQGTLWFTYKGQRLTDIRVQMEKLPE